MRLELTNAGCLLTMRIASIALILLLMTSLNAWSRPDGFDHTEWDTLLKDHVRATTDGHSTQVDYAAFQRDSAALDQYLQQLAAVDRQSFDRWSQAEQLAFLINAYNAWTVKLILTRWPDLESIKDLGGFFSSPWKKTFIPLFGQEHSLDDIEHGLIRESGRYQEPRIHFAVNCASIGCPALRSEAYTGEHLEHQLEEQTTLFLSDRTRNRLDGNTLALSSIFKWYAKDFERGWQGYTTLSMFLHHYAQALGLDSASLDRLDNATLKIRFLDYDWSLNG